MKKISTVCFSILISFSLQTNAQQIQIEELAVDLDVNERANVQVLDKPLIVEFYNGGGFSAWFRVNWYDEEQFKIVSKRSNTFGSGHYVRYEIPAGTELNTVRVEGYSITGLVWAQNKQAFNHFLTDKHLYDYRSRYYYAIQAKGTSLRPYGQEYKPAMGIDGMDPYSDNPYECTKVTTTDGLYGNLTSPAKQFELRNVCQYKVLFTLENKAGKKQYTVNANSTGYAFSTPQDPFTWSNVRRPD